MKFFLNKQKIIISLIKIFNKRISNKKKEWNYLIIIIWIIVDN